MEKLPNSWEPDPWFNKRKGNLEKCAEDVRGWSCCEDEGEEGTEASVKNSRSNVSHSLDSSQVRGPSLLHKVVSNVSAVVHTQPDRNDQVDAADCVDGQTPEVDEAANIDEREEDAEEDEDTGGEALDQNESCDEDTE